MTEKNTVTIDMLRQVLERFGANSERWPPAQRGALATLVDSDPEAKALHDEFVAFDQLLEDHASTMASEASARHDDLSSKILRSATAQNDREQDRHTVVPFDSGRERAGGRRRGSTTYWPRVATTGALAASLMLGISIGAAGIANQALNPLSEALGLGSIETETAALADPIFDVVDDGGFDDDVL